MSALARWCFRNRYTVIVMWLVALVCVGGLSFGVASTYHDDFQLPNTDSKHAMDLLQNEFPQQSGETDQIVVHAKTGTVNDPAVRSAVEGMFAQIATAHLVTGVGSFYAPDAAQQISQDGTIAFANIQLNIPENAELPQRDVKNIIRIAQHIDSSNLQVEVGGPSFQSNGSEGVGSTEALGLAAAAVVLFLAFGSLFAMMLPMVTAMMALGLSMSVVGLLTHVMSIPTFAPSLAALIGLGVGIDYALFIVSRHRANLQQGQGVEESAASAIDTSGRAVMVAGITVCVALLGLFLVDVKFLYGVALSASIAVLFTMLAALTLLPAMLGCFGMRVLSRKEQKFLAANGPQTSQDLSPRWYKWSSLVARHPIAWAALALAVMLTLSVPVLHLRLGSADAGSDPSASTSRKSYDLLARGFGAGFSGPLQLVANLQQPSDMQTFQKLVDGVQTQANVVSVTPPIVSPNGKAAVVLVYPETSPQDAATTSLINRLRHDVIPAAESGSNLKVYVGGQTAIFEDFASVLTHKLPVFMGAVIVLAFLLLLTLFRSIVIPIKASIMNLLAAGAGFGVVVAVFQWGWGASLIGVDRTGPILPFLPVMLFAILFGLSMDYEVFLVSRMHEEWLRTKNNDEAIALGQAETGRVITAAAAIMVVVFGSFVLGSDPTIKLFGVGLAASILLDALIIRTILVPSAMHLFGRFNWYLPSWLDRVVPRVSVDHSTPPEELDLRTNRAFETTADDLV